MKLRLEGQAFNLFNHPNLRVTNGRVCRRSRKTFDPNRVRSVYLHHRAADRIAWRRTRRRQFSAHDRVSGTIGVLIRSIRTQPLTRARIRQSARGDRHRITPLKSVVGKLRRIHVLIRPYAEFRIMPSPAGERQRGQSPNLGCARHNQSADKNARSASSGLNRGKPPSTGCSFPSACSLVFRSAWMYM